MEDKWALFQKFLITESVQISLEEFIINSVIVVILSYILERTYRVCAKSISNRSVFAANFMLIAFTTMLIISIVKSSLALSLGLVGALSIVRFRAAIKEPEELAYLFFAIAIGLGLGANQRYIVIAAFAVLSIILWTRYFTGRKKEKQNLFFSVNCDTPQNLQLDDINRIVRSHFKAAELKRFDENKDLIGASYLVDVDNTSKLQLCKAELQQLSDSVSVSFIDSKNA
jgi:hypothetical protein